jgi:hypothetical protein
MLENMSEQQAEDFMSSLGSIGKKIGSGLAQVPNFLGKNPELLSTIGGIAGNLILPGAGGMIGGALGSAAGGLLQNKNAQNNLQQQQQQNPNAIVNLDAAKLNSLMQDPQMQRALMQMSTSNVPIAPLTSNGQTTHVPIANFLHALIRQAQAALQQLDALIPPQVQEALVENFGEDFAGEDLGEALLEEVRANGGWEEEVEIKPINIPQYALNSTEMNRWRGELSDFTSKYVDAYLEIRKKGYSMQGTLLIVCFLKAEGSNMGFIRGGGLNEFLDKLNTRWQRASTLFKRTKFTTDEINDCLNSGPYYNNSGYSYNTDIQEKPSNEATKIYFSSNGKPVSLGVPLDYGNYLFNKGIKSIMSRWCVLLKDKITTLFSTIDGWECDITSCSSAEKAALVSMKQKKVNLEKVLQEISSIKFYDEEINKGRFEYYEGISNQKTTSKMLGEVLSSPIYAETIKIIS